jgi:hypothetical protein
MCPEFYTADGLYWTNLTTDSYCLLEWDMQLIWMCEVTQPANNIASENCALTEQKFSFVDVNSCQLPSIPNIFVANLAFLLVGFPAGYQIGVVCSATWCTVFVYSIFWAKLFAPTSQDDLCEIGVGLIDACRVLIGKPEGKKSLGKPRLR